MGGPCPIPADRPAMKQALRTLGCALPLLLAACSSPHDSRDVGNTVDVVRATETAAPSPAPTVTVRAAPSATPSPPPVPPGFRTAPRLVPHKAFTDPPLPPELQDDGGLTPLPPPPHR